MLLNLLVKPAYLLLAEAEVQNRLGSEQFGHYTALLSLGFLLNIFLDLGINTFTSRELSRRKKVAGDYLSTVVLLRMLLAAVYFVLLFLVAVVLGYASGSLIILGWIGINQLLAASVLYIRSNLSGLHLFKQDAVLSVLDRTIALLLLMVLLYGGVYAGSFDIRWLIGVQTIAYGCAIIAGLAFLLPRAGKIRLRWRPRLNRLVLNQSIPYALLVLLMMVYYKTDAVMLERMRVDGAWHAGVYAMGYRLFEASNMMGYLLATLLLPLFSKMLAQGLGIVKLADSAFRLAAAASISLALLCFFWSERILALIYDHDIEAAAPLFGLLMLAFVFMMTSYVWGTLLTANGNMRTMNIIAGAAVLLNITLNLFLIPSHGAVGSAAASLATQVLVAVCQIALAHKYLRAAPHWKVWLRIVAFIIALMVTATILKNTFEDATTQLFVFIGVAVSIAFASQLIKPTLLRELLRSE